MKFVRPKLYCSILESEFIKIPFYGNASKHTLSCLSHWWTLLSLAFDGVRELKPASVRKTCLLM